MRGWFALVAPFPADHGSRDAFVFGYGNQRVEAWDVDTFDLRAWKI